MFITSETTNYLKMEMSKYHFWKNVHYDKKGGLTEKSKHVIESSSLGCGGCNGCHGCSDGVIIEVDNLESPNGCAGCGGCGVSS